MREPPDEAARDKLATLVQRRGVQDYATQYQNLMLELPRMDEKDRIHNFIAGLKPDVRVHVKLRQPASLNEALALAAQADNVIWSEKRSKGPHNPPRQFQPPKPEQANTTGEATPMELGQLQRSTVTCFYYGKVGHVKRDCRKLKADNAAGKKSRGRSQQQQPLN